MLIRYKLCITSLLFEVIFIHKNRKSRHARNLFKKKRKEESVSFRVCSRCRGPGCDTGVCAQLLHCVRLFVSTWTVAHQTPLSMGFSKQGYWSGLPFPSPRDLPWPRDWICVSMSLALAGRFFTTSTTWEDEWFITGIWPYTITIIG